MKYLSIFGLLIIAIGSFLPDRWNYVFTYARICVVFPILGFTLFYLLSRDHSEFGRFICGIVGLIPGVLAIISLTDTQNIPYAMGINIGLALPVIIFGSLMVCIGGFMKNKLTANRFGSIYSFIIIISVLISMLFAFGAFFFKMELVFLFTYSIYQKLPIIGLVSTILIIIAAPLQTINSLIFIAKNPTL